MVAKSEIELEVLFDFFDAVHDGGMVFDADFGGDFIGTETEFGGKDKHGDLTSGFDVGDARFTGEFFNRKIVVFGDLFNDLFWGGGTKFRRFIDTDGSVLNEL